MGDPLVQPLTIIFMDSLGEKMLQTAPNKLASYDRYVEDCLLLWTHSETKLIRLIDHCSQKHASISFTGESTVSTGSVSFMDLTINIGECYHLELN